MMTDKQKPETNPDTNSLVDGFHRASSLVPVGQSLMSITRHTTVVEALAIMQEHHFSQLPVMAGSALLGMFSYRSFCAKALAKQKSSRKDWLGRLPVEEFLEVPQYVPPNEDWTNIQRHLDEQDHFFVGHPDLVDGLVTTMDVYEYFRSIADPFILITEIELALRRIIAACIPQESRDEAFERSLAGAYDLGNVPKLLMHMTLNDCVQIISTRENWHYFEQILGSDDTARKNASKKLKPIPGWRNDTFHFRKQLEEYELKNLVECRNWLHRSVRAFEGHKRDAERKARLLTTTTPRKGKTNRKEMLAACESEAAEFFAWMLDEAASHNFTVEWGTTGFSVRANISGRMASFAYGYPVDTFRTSFVKNLKLSPAEETAWRKELLAIGVFQESGKKSLSARVTPQNTSRLREAFMILIKKVKRLNETQKPA